MQYLMPYTPPISCPDEREPGRDCLSYQQAVREKVAVFDTTRIHAGAALDYAFGRA